VLVLGGLQVGKHFLGEFGQEPAPDEVVLLDKHLAQAGLAKGVVLEVEPVKSETEREKVRGDVFFFVFLKREEGGWFCLGRDK